ncbi:MAG TPA: hypothetical protein VKZ18_04230 [Polyangia bacterium]|nr:hypothetical protein [Polyangia bacterium]
MRRWGSASVVVALGLVGAAPRARACSPELPPAATAIPRAGATGVSTATSIVVVSPREPFGVEVTADGQPVPVSGWGALGAGVDGSGGATSFWRLWLGGVGALLAGNTDYVVTLPGGAGAGGDAGAPTLTTFSTAAGYDKAAGTPANVRGLHLWRVRYPVADIASGNCVLSEYVGFLTVDYDPATIPNTAPGSVVQSFQLAPDTGGTQQTFVYTGDAPFAGLAPAGDYPLPLGQWQPDLDPTRRYCLGVSSIGDGDLARPATGSNTVCADVVQLSATGAPPAPSAGAGGSSGGCSTAGTGASWLAAILALVAAVSLGRRPQRRRAPRRRR